MALDTTIDEIWGDDLLDRASDAAFLEDFLTARAKEKLQESAVTGAYVLNIDAEWGAGKSFFLDRFGRQLERSGHLVARVNAWRDDYVDDPFVSVLASIDDVLVPYTHTASSKLYDAWRNVKKSAAPVLKRAAIGLGKTALKKYTGYSLDELTTRESESDDSYMPDDAQHEIDHAAAESEKIIDSEMDKLISSHKKSLSSIEDFKDRLHKAVELLGKEKVKPPLFILIDEMDRCRPTYAVSMLERVKHLFDVKSVVFVFATNTKQLQHIIKGAYGGDFDGYTYLKRFFDKTYYFDAPRTINFIASKIDRIDQKKLRAPNISGDIEISIITFLERSCEIYNLSLREIEHIMDIVKTVVTVWPNARAPVDLTILFPIAVNLYRTGSTDYSSTLASIPEKFLLTRPHFSDKYGRFSKSVTYNMRIIFSNHVTLMNKIGDAMEYGNNTEDAEQRYIHETYVPEWNGLPVNRDSPSVQASIAKFVRNAGKLVERPTPGDGKGARS